MLKDKIKPEDKAPMIMGINTFSIGQKGAVVRNPMRQVRPIVYTSVYSPAFAATSECAVLESSFEESYQLVPLCLDYYSPRPNEIIVVCRLEAENKEQSQKPALIDIENIIQELTATDEGKALWQKAQEKVNAELWDKVKEGRMTKIKYFRIVKGFTQKELADKAGMKQPDVSRIEKPDYKDKVATATYKKLAQVLGVDYKDLMP